MPKPVSKNTTKAANSPSKINLKKKVVLGSQTSFDTLESRARALIENMDLAVWMGDKDEYTIYANPKFCELVGYKLSEMIGNQSYMYWTKESADLVKKINQTDRKKGISSSYVAELVTKKGDRIPVGLNGTPLPDGGTVGIMHDLRDVKNKEREIQDLLHRFDMAVRGSKDALWYAEVPTRDFFKLNFDEGHFVWCSPRFKEMFGWRNKLPNTFNQWMSLFHPADLKRAVADVRKTLKARSSFEIECRLKVAGGDYKWFSIRGEGVPERSNGTLFIAGSLRDIDDKKQTENDLVASKKIFDDLVKGSPTAMFMINTNHEVVYWNDSLEQITGIKAKDIIGTKDHWKPFYNKQRDMIADMMIDGLKNREILKFYKHMDVEECSDKDGIVGSVYFTNFRSQKRWLRFIIKPLRDHQNKIIGAVETVEDITERRQVNEALAKRIREFQVLYQVQAHIQMVLPISRVLNDVKNDIVMACRDPKFARAWIMFDGQIYTNLKRNEELICKIEEPIKVSGKTRGLIQLGYTVHLPHDNGPVLKEERKLLQIVSQAISKHVRSREVMERYQQLVQKSINGIYIVQDGLFQYVNPSFRKMFKVKDGEVIGQPFASLVLGCECCDKLLENVKPSSLRCESKGKRSDGVGIDIEVVNRRIDYYGRPAILGTIQDVSRLKQAEKKLRNFNQELKVKIEKKTKDLEEANRRLRSLNELKDEFIAVTSHELRSPLTSIRGYLSFLRDEDIYSKLPDDARNYLDRAYDNVHVLNNLMNNILDVSRIDTNRLELHRAPTDLIRLISNVIDNLSYQAQQNEIKLVFVNQIAEPSLVLSIDAVRMQQVMRNILENAIKYTPKRKQITVKLELTGIGVQLSVTDQGVGIPKSQIFDIFDKFKQSKNSNARFKGGVGLGLFISKRIIELHDGMIWAESELKKGTTFNIQLPII